MDEEDGGAWSLTLVLVVGVLAFLAAVLAAHRDPATGYEVSIYVATTPAFWAGTGLAVLCALVVSLAPRSSRGVRRTALALATAAVLAVAALPLVRGQFFSGRADSLSHLGWARMMAGEVPGAPLSPVDLLYPGVHATAVSVSGVMGVPLPRAFLLVVAVYALAFFVFVPLCVHALVRSELALVLGTVSGLLLLPVNNVSVFHVPYPTGQAIYLLPLLLFLVAAFVLSGRGDGRGIAWGVLLAVASLALLFVHPIIAGPTLLSLAAIAGLQFVYRRLRPEHPIAGHRPLYANVAVLGVAYVLWSRRFPRVRAQASSLVEGLLFGSPPVADEVASRTGSLAALGGSLPEMYAKLFLVPTVFSFLAAAVGLASLGGRLDGGGPDRRTLVAYLTVAAVPIVGAFLAFFLASLSVLPFRIVGVAMVLSTILGAVAVAHVLPRFPTPPSRRAVRRVLVVVLFVALVLQGAHLYQSPYIYRGSEQVSEQVYAGHAVAFEHREPALAWAGPRHGPHRYVDAIYGTSFGETTPGGAVFEGAEAGVPYRVFGHNMTTFFVRDRYVPVTRVNDLVEVRLYDGLRYSREAMARVEATPGIHRIHSNGEFRLYYVAASGGDGDR